MNGLSDDQDEKVHDPTRTTRQRDALDELLDSAPIDDEPTSQEEEEGLREPREEIARGEVISLDEIKREIGLTEAARRAAG